MLSFIKSKQVYFYLLLLCSVGIGLQIALYKIAIIALLLQWILGANFKSKLDKLKANNFGIIFIILYLLYALSLIWSDNVSVALTDLLLKSPMFILPLVILSQSTLTNKQINSILLSFVLSSIALNLYCLVDAYFTFLKTNTFNQFYYHRLTVNMHTAYQAMFTCFSIAILIYLRIKEKLIENWLMYSGVFIQFILILLLSSRMQILIMITLVPIYLIFKYYKERKIYLGVIYTLIIFGLMQFIMTAPSSLNYRYKQTITHVSSIGVDSGNSDPRKFIWENGLDVIKKNWLLGVGAGDAKDILIERYKLNILENPISESLMDSTIISLESNTKLVDYLKKKSQEKEVSYDYQLNQYAKNSLERRNNRFKNFVKRAYNFHNQYLQTFGTIGIFGLLLLLYLLAIPFFKSIKELDYLSAIFLFIVGSSFLTESMLERQAGVSFIVFFFVILFASKYQEE